MRNLDIALLRAFVAVSENGGMTRAARALNLTQGAVSQQIKRLEETLDWSLFEREKSLSLTVAGERLLPHAKRLLELNDAIWGMACEPEMQGVLRLGMPYDIVPFYLAPILRSFNREYPRIEVDIQTAASVQLLDLLAKGELDLAISTLRHPDPKSKILRTEPLVWAGAADGVAFRRKPLPVVFGSEACAFRAATVEVLAEQGLDWRAICVGGGDAMTAMVRADLAVVPVLRSCVPESLVLIGAEGGLPALPSFNIALHRVEAARKNALCEALIEAIDKGFDAMVGEGRIPAVAVAL